jgi:NAD(P)H-hydrate epimerase
LTPHPKEFERFFGTTTNDLERIKLAAIKAQELHLIIVLKGHHTCVSLPEGKQFFNATGNSGMAKGGSGDVLTGVVTALVAQGYSPADAALFGVYLHGLSGDLAAKHLSKEAMTASDTIRFLAQAFLSINSQARL